MSLVAAVILLLFGLAGLLWVSYVRDQRYESEMKSLRDELIRKEDSLQRLKEQLIFPMEKRDAGDGWSSSTKVSAPDSLFSAKE